MCSSRNFFKKSVVNAAIDECDIEVSIGDSAYNV